MGLGKYALRDAAGEKKLDASVAPAAQDKQVGLPLASFFDDGIFCLTMGDIIKDAAMRELILNILGKRRQSLKNCGIVFS
ncbi:MAG: hypothetical protein BWY75_02314 [bacterium ADurb.Bin425]|nr:MAG: hypothetical protein BWY75_02314 [bacterium ADurb.Bin425]